MKEVLGCIRRADTDFRMISSGDRIAVGVSGGKDSLMLLYALALYRRFCKNPYTLTAVTLTLGLAPTDTSAIAALCETLDVPYVCRETDIGDVVFNQRKEKNPCSLCAKMRRGALNDAIRERGISKLALGHHFDDAVETFMMNLLFEGRLGCFRPVTYLDRSGVTQIRPMIYAGEGKIANLAEKLELPVVENPCPMDKTSKRHEIKEMLKSMCADYPDMKSKIFGSMQRLPLAGWGIEKS